MGAVLLAGCLPQQQLLDEHRPLGTAAGDGYTVEFRATLMAWHDPAGCRGEFLCGWEPRHDTAAVGFDVWVRAHGDQFVRGFGEPDHTEWTNGPCPGVGHGAVVTGARAAYAASSVEVCAGPGRFVYRVRDPGGPQTPWRVGVVLPDRVLYAFVDGDPPTCEAALAAVPPVEVWVRDRARGVCAGLADLDPVEALRCEMREGDPRALGVASRGNPTLGEVDAALADAVLDPAAADTTRYAPYRVRALVDGVADPDALGGTQARLEARCAGACLPWERLAAARIAARRSDRDACLAALAGVDALRTGGDDTSAAAVLVGVQDCGVDDALAPRMATLWLEPTPPIDDVWACPPERSVSDGMFCQAVPDVAAEWAASACPTEIVAEAGRRSVDPSTPDATRARATRIVGSCSPSAEAFPTR